MASVEPGGFLAAPRLELMFVARHGVIAEASLSCNGEKLPQVCARPVLGRVLNTICDFKHLFSGTLGEGGHELGVRLKSIFGQ
jgi:hypothetical protein